MSEQTLIKMDAKESLAPREYASMTPMEMISSAVEAGNIDLVAKLMDLQERWDANQARKAFDAAIAAALSLIHI